MTLEQVRKLLLRRCKPFISGYGNSQTGIRPWCEAHGVASTHASEFLNGKRGPAPDLLDALGLEWRVMRKPIPRCPQHISEAK
jgi:hypothetical protein